MERRPWLHTLLVLSLLTGTGCQESGPDVSRTPEPGSEINTVGPPAEDAAPVVKSEQTSDTNWLDAPGEGDEGRFFRGLYGWLNDANCTLKEDDFNRLVQALQQPMWDDAQILNLNLNCNLIDKFNNAHGERSSDKVCELTERSKNLFLAGFLEDSLDQFQGCAPGHRQRIEEMRWRILATEPVVEDVPLPAPLVSMRLGHGWVPEKPDAELAAQIEAVAGNSKTVYQGHAVRALLEADFEVYFPKLSPGFKDLNPQAKAFFAAAVLQKSEDEDQQEQYLQHLLDFVQLDDPSYLEADYLNVLDRSVEAFVIIVLDFLDSSIGSSRDGPRRQRVESATVAALKHLATRDDDRARKNLFYGLSRNIPFFKKYVESAAEILAYGAKGTTPDALSAFLLCAHQIDSPLGHARALELLQSKDPAMVSAGLGGLKMYGRGEDADVILPFTKHEDEGIVHAAVYALAGLEPLPLEQLVSLLDAHPDTPLAPVRSWAFHNLHMKLNIEIEFDWRKSGTELADEKGRVVGWLKEHGHLD
jgi:hypothetical protein